MKNLDEDQLKDLVEASIYARELLWKLLVEAEKKNISLRDDDKANINQCHELLEEATRDIE